MFAGTPAFGVFKPRRKQAERAALRRPSPLPSHALSRTLFVTRVVTIRDKLVRGSIVVDPTTADLHVNVRAVVIVKFVIAWGKSAFVSAWGDAVVNGTWSSWTCDLARAAIGTAVVTVVGSIRRWRFELRLGLLALIIIGVAILALA
jgi:hypothetical protein